jgi:hypothetical protein
MGELSDNPAPPQKRRRRWLIVVLVLVLALGLGWWSARPKIDPRLVGTWELDADGRGQIGFRLLADGSAEIPSRQQLVGVKSLPRPWKVEGDILFISMQGTHYDSVGERVELQMRSIWERVMSPAEADMRLRIVEVKPDSLKLEWLDGPREVSTYHRLPDGQKIDMGRIKILPGH